MTDVTIVVSTRNRCDRLAETLGRHEGPVILVDNDSRDGTPEFVRRHFPQVKVVTLDHNAGAAGRNIGVRLADTPFVAFADDDSYWAEGSLRRAGEVLRAHPSAGLLTARVLVGPSAWPDPVSDAMATAPLGTPAGHAGPSVLGFLACAAAVRREAFLQVGGFNPVLHVYGEEALLAMDLAAAGWQLSYVPALTVHHLPMPAGRDTTARHRREVRNRVLTALLRRPPRVLRREIGAGWRDRAGRLGLADAARMLPWALRHRRPLPPQVEHDLTRLHDLDAEATVGDAPATA